MPHDITELYYWADNYWRKSPPMSPPFPCPCCGHLVFDSPPGSLCICPVCRWKDDVTQLRFPGATVHNFRVKSIVGTNSFGLIAAQKNYAQFGESDTRDRGKPKVLQFFDKDPQWRPIDSEHDNYEKIERGKEYDLTIPADLTIYYYWRVNRWGMTRFREEQLASALR